MIDIEQHALRALEQDFRARFAHFLEPPPHRLGILQHVRRDLAQLRDQRGAIDRRFSEPGAQGVMVRA